MSDIAPSLSVIVPFTTPPRHGPGCLATLAQACHGQPVEIILASGSDSAPAGDPVVEYPGVTVVRAQPPAALPRLLGGAISRARGGIIAVLDGGCGVDENWLPAVVKAHEAPYPVIGGAVEPDGLKSVVDWAAYFFDYGQFMPPLAEGVSRHVPGINFSVKRWALGRGREWVEGEFWKSYWCRRLQAEGHDLYLVPSIVVSYRRSFRVWPFLLERFRYGRCFAGMRLEELSRAARVIHAAGSPVLPILLCARILRAVLPKQRHVREFLFSFPIIVLAAVSWGIGETCGYLLGPGRSCRYVR